MVSHRDFSRSQGAPIGPLTGGIDQKTPPTAVQPHASPDAQNVLHHNISVKRRGGFPPLIRQGAKRAAIVNAGFHGRALENEAATTDTDFLIVPGAMYAGHRAVHDNLLDEVTIEFFMRIDDLTAENIGNGNSAASAPFGPAPFKVSVRPIVTKGPLKRTAEATAITAYWGAPAASNGMPWGFWLQNVGTVGTPNWKLVFGAHVIEAAIPTFHLATVQSGIVPTVGKNYHVIGVFSIANQVMRLRVGEVTDVRTTPTYTHNENDFTITYTNPITATTGNPCPIQVFDCPQDLIEAPAPATTITRPQGLNLGGQADGGVFFGMKRFEGAFEELVIHEGDLLSVSASALDRNRKYDQDNLPSTVRQCWPMTEVGMDMVQEVTGHGNHLYLSPRGPIYDGISGGPRPTGSWWFNGQTSYAMAKLGRNVAGQRGASDDGNPNWRYFADASAPRDMAMMQACVLANRQHGLDATIWLDSIEPGFEQVIAEIHSVLRLAIDTDGTLLGYCRDTQTNVGAVVTHGYQGPVKGTTVLKPGRRYHVAVTRTNGGGSLNIYINQVLEATLGVTASSAGGQPIGGLTIGMGQAFPSTHTLDIVSPIEPDALTGANEELNTYHRSGFCGRIEQVTILTGAGGQSPLYSDAQINDFRHPQSLLWETPFAGVQERLAPDDLQDLVAADPGRGAALEASGDVQIGTNLRYFLDDPGSTGSHFYVLRTAAPFRHDLRTVGNGGHALQGRVVRAYRALARWVLNVDDGYERDPGAFIRDVELRTESGVRTFSSQKHVHPQGSLVTDDLGALGTLQKRCVEPDLLTDDALNMIDRDWTARNRPYSFRHPIELGPQWDCGIAWPRSDQAPVTLLASWQHEETGERFLITAVSRSLYWARVPWRQASPFRGEIAARCPWGFGSDDSYLKFPGTETEQEIHLGTPNVVELEVWCYPTRLDGNRLLAYKGDLGSDINFAVFFVDGVLNVVGTMAGSTAFWETEGVSSTLKANAWNHVRVCMDPGAPSLSADVNGIPVQLTAVAGFDAFGSAEPDASNYDLYLMGIPCGAKDTTFAYAGGGSTAAVTFGNWHGFITEYRQRNLIASTPPLPRARYSDDANTYYLLHLNEGSGWALTESAGNITNGNGVVELDELVKIATGLEESTGSRYNFAVYRNRLYITNGRAYPQAISFRRFSHPGGPFLVTRLGVQPPYQEIPPTDVVFTAGGGTIATGQYQAWIAFVGADRQSEPAQMWVEDSGGTFDHIYWDRLPRAFNDPQVNARIIFLSPPGGGAPVRRATLLDNETRDWQTIPAVGTEGIEVNQKFPAPKAKQIAVGQGSMWLANLTDIPAGANAFQVSSGETPVWWPGSLIQLVDSEDGKPITAIRGHFGPVYLNKRDSTWQETLQGAVGLPVPFNVNASIGLGGGVTAYDNAMYGAGDKGIHAFTGADMHYMSMALEDDYRNLIDQTDEGLEVAFGTYYWPNSQYWISMREHGRENNRTIFVLQTDLQTVIGQMPQHPWAKLVVPEHSYMGSMLDPLTDEPVLLLGGLNGSILRYDESVLVDGAVDGTLAGTATGTTSTSLTMAGASFSTVGHGLRGAVVWINSNGTLVQRRIESNTATTLTWLEPATLVATPTFEIGAYDSYWTTPWYSVARFGSYSLLDEIDLDYAPSPGTVLQVYVQVLDNAPKTTSRLFPTLATAELLTKDLSEGWTEDPLAPQKQTRGRYARARFGVVSPGQDFQINAWQFRTSEAGQRGG